MTNYPLSRPAEADAAPYSFTYIDQVDGDDCLATMTVQLDEALTFFSGITEDTSLHCYAPEKWTIRQSLSHVNDTERIFLARALWFARGFDSPLASFDQECRGGRSGGRPAALGDAR